MRWRINNFIFCERQQTLSIGEDTVQLEPMVVELLAYFCKNPNQIISRTQLIDVVWLGRMITDNAVNKVVTKLRKSFNDDARKPRFIATFPKKGYKFIAAVSELNEEILNNKNSIQKPLTPTKSNKIYGSLTLLALLTIIGLVMTWQNNKTQLPMTQVKALSSEPGRESRPQMSPDGQFFAYTEVRDKKIHQWIKSLKDETVIEINHRDAQNIWVDSVSWNSDGSQIIYLATTPQSCQYFIRSFKDMQVGEPKLIHNCPVGSYGKIAFTHDDNRVIYTENMGRGTPFSLFEFNLNSGLKRRLNQPELFLGGNIQFDLHPTENKLLVSSPDQQQWEGFYSLNFDTDELVLLFKQDAYICCGIWNHSGDRVVMMGEHPSYQIVSYNLQGENRQVIYTSSGLVIDPERHVNGKDYMFSFLQVNHDAHLFDFSTNNKTVIANTSVDDRLAVFAYHSNQVAYIGLSSGTEEVWLTDIDGMQRMKLTNFNDSRHYIELLWSYNGKYLIGLALNEIHLIDSTSGQSEVLKIPQVEIRGVSWKSDEVISYSIKTKDGWQLNYYNINTHTATSEDEKWAFIRYAENSEDILKQDSDGHLFSGDKEVEVMDSELQEVDLLNGRTFNLKKSASKWAWQERIDSKYQLKFKESFNTPTKPLIETDSYHFDLNDSGVIYHTVKSLNADIYQTVAE